MVWCIIESANKIGVSHRKIQSADKLMFESMFAPIESLPCQREVPSDCEAEGFPQAVTDSTNPRNIKNLYLSNCKD